MKKKKWRMDCDTCTNGIQEQKDFAARFLISVCNSSISILFCFAIFGSCNQCSNFIFHLQPTLLHIPLTEINEFWPFFFLGSLHSKVPKIQYEIVNCSSWMAVNGQLSANWTKLKIFYQKPHTNNAGIGIGWITNETSTKNVNNFQNFEIRLEIYFRNYHQINLAIEKMNTKL